MQGAHPDVGLGADVHPRVQVKHLRSTTGGRVGAMADAADSKHRASTHAKVRMRRYGGLRVYDLGFRVTSGGRYAGVVCLRMSSSATRMSLEPSWCPLQALVLP